MPPGGPLPGPASERSTIEHVANAAGVSVATVSRALRGLPNVAVSTRARVEEAARELKYRPDPAASRLAAGRSHAIAVVVPLINSWYFSNVVAGAEAVCAEVGYDLLVLTAPNAITRRQAVDTAAALDRRVDGLIFVEVALEPDDVADLAARRLGVVTIGQETSAFPSVRVDNAAIGRIAVDHLLALGHRRIGVLGAQAEAPAYFDVPGQRIAGAAEALAAVGSHLDPQLVGMGEFTVEGGHDAGVELLSRPERPTAIFALSDEMAFGAVIAVARPRPVDPRRRVARRRRRPRGRRGARPDDRAPARGRARRPRRPRPAAPARRVGTADPRDRPPRQRRRAGRPLVDAAA